MYSLFIYFPALHPFYAAPSGHAIMWGGFMVLFRDKASPDDVTIWHYGDRIATVSKVENN